MDQIIENLVNVQNPLSAWSPFSKPCFWSTSLPLPCLRLISQNVLNSEHQQSFCLLTTACHLVLWSVRVILPLQFWNCSVLRFHLPTFPLDSSAWLCSIESDHFSCLDLHSVYSLEKPKGQILLRASPCIFLFTCLISASLSSLSESFEPAVTCPLLWDL